MYRVHDSPDPATVEAMSDFLAELGLRLPRGRVARPALFNGVLARAAGTGNEALVSELVLRCQARAVYAPDNLGHFGLGLARYCHFTSPIRRYADILVHRALVGALDLGPGALPEGAGTEFGEIGETVSGQERRAVAAERDAGDRYAAAFLGPRVGGLFEGRVGGVTHFGLFVTLEETGADGFVPISTLPSDYYDHDARRHCLVGRETGRRYGLGDAVEVRLAEADPMTGSLVLEIMGGGSPGHGKARDRGGRARPRRGGRRR
jgi:ribonuclease R